MGMLSFLGSQTPAIGQQNAAPGLASMLGGQPQPQTGVMGFLDRVMNPTNALGQLGKSLAQAGGGLWGDTMTLMDRQKAQGQDSLLKQIEMQQAIRKGMQPQTTQVGKSFGTVDAQGNFHPTYTAPEDKDSTPGFGKDLEAAGYKPGTPEYQQHYRNYVAQREVGPPVAIERYVPGVGMVTELRPRSSFGGSAPGGPVATPAAPSPAAGFDGFYNGYLKGAEGGYTSNDGNGYPANGGVNAKFHPEFPNVKDMTPDQIKGVHQQYWQQSGADKIPDPRLAAIHADTAINMGPAVAQRLLAQAGGDPVAYMRLRDQHIRSLKGAIPPGFRTRQHKLAQYIASLGGAAPAVAPPAGGVAASNEDEE
jgi:hypothetical protein